MQSWNGSLLLLDALRGKNQAKRPPVWLMRQAGRYLPEYRALRERHSLRELFFTPELAADVTLMPVKRFELDAAILFSDITAIAPALGLDLSFDEGPVLAKYVTPRNWSELVKQQDALEPIFQAVRLVKARTHVPLIGFCGGPFTVATYLIEKHHGVPHKTRAWMREDPAGFSAFLGVLTQLSIDSLKSQIEAGVDAIQVFDSWASALDEVEFERYCLSPLASILQSVSVPAIVFCRGSGVRAARIAERLPGVTISIDEEKSMSEVRRNVKAPLQGNLNPEVLFGPPEAVRQAVRELLEAMRGDPGFVVNLGHGVRPGTPVESVAALVSEVREFS